MLARLAFRDLDITVIYSLHALEKHFIKYQSIV